MLLVEEETERSLVPEAGEECFELMPAGHDKSHCTHGPTAAGVSTRHAQDQACQHAGRNRKGAHEVPPLAEGLLAVDGH